ncbi:MAG: hypothetical protein PHU24_10115 [Sphaerochaetaceae bacterium]|nr:hypothetical protein [Sphaerochaetaceae bacterium]NLO60064.1 hypothetical protein [Spirochaetales bacterium]MDD2406797.1 hypothetical protein [Sphaerochaetaceae bacterium]MDD3671778.1 hypothetical protein [Sphaerochaetaceae bacterium]MDD4258510.1 hypothetical protein [Sphaerochaetaceae bacterium]
MDIPLDIPELRRWLRTRIQELIVGLSSFSWQKGVNKVLSSAMWQARSFQYTMVKKNPPRCFQLASMRLFQQIPHLAIVLKLSNESVGMEVLLWQQC